jgi:hypothetical protein
MTNSVVFEKPDPVPDALHTVFTHAHETPFWVSRSSSAHHTSNYGLINSPNPDAQASSVWRIPAFSKHENLHGYHPKGKPLKLVRRALLASTRQGELVFDPFCGSGTTAVAAKELNRAFVGAGLEEEFAKLAAQHVQATERGRLLQEVSEQFWNNAFSQVLCDFPANRPNSFGIHSVVEKLSERRIARRGKRISREEQDKGLIRGARGRTEQEYTCVTKG